MNSRPQGRPRKPATKKKGAWLKLRVTPSLKAAVQEAAEAAGLSVSEYVRVRLRGQEMKAREDREIRDLLREAGRQIIRMTEAAEAIGQPLGEVKAERAIEEIRAALREL